MAAKLKLPKKIIKSDWQEDIDFEPYRDEKTYISPNEIRKETIEKIKKSPIKLSIRKMIDWDKINQKLAA